jgi:caffeoyl-CoA O-methyltransferase
MKDPLVLEALKELEALEKRDDLEEPLWRISYETGLLLNIMLRHSRATRVLEVGTSSGYSTLFLADAVRQNGGKVYTCEMSPFKCNLARETFEKAGLSDWIVLLEGNALETLEKLEGPWDLVFLDGMKDEYVFYLTSIWEKVRVGGLVVADNIISHKGTLGIEAYQFTTDVMDDAITVTVPIGSGEALTCKVETEGDVEEREA